MSEQNSIKRRKTALKECALFSALSEAELEKVAGFSVEKEYEPGSIIFNEGDNAQELFLLQEGRIALQLQVNLHGASTQMGRRITVDIVAEKEVLGWSALVEPYLYTLTTVCLQKVRVLAINANELRALLRNQANVGYQVLKGLIKVVASRLEDIRQLLISERLLVSQDQEPGSKARVVRR